jgi:transitional endoplasmic reticulum ATPase
MSLEPPPVPGPDPTAGGYGGSRPVPLVVVRLAHGDLEGEEHDHSDHAHSDQTHDHAHGHGATSDVCMIGAESLAAVGLVDKGVVEVETDHRRTALLRVVVDPRPGTPATVRLSRTAMRTLKLASGALVDVRRVDVTEARRVVLEPLAPLTGSLTSYEDELSDTLGGGQALVAVGMLVAAPLSDFRRPVLFRVLTSAPERAVVGPDTRVVLRSSMMSPGTSANLVTFDDVGGLDAEVDLVRELIECPLMYPHVYDQLGIEAPRGILLHGPPGVGKTHLARAIANEIGAHFVYVNGPEILSSVQGGTEANLRSIFEEAMESAPSVVLIDEIDALAPPRRDTGHTDARMGTQLLSLLDGLVSMEDVIVVGTTNRPEGLDPALRRPGRLDRELMIGPPSVAGRLDILRIHTRGMPLDDDAQSWLPELAARTHGYTGADLVNLTREAGLHALRRVAGSGLRQLGRGVHVDHLVVRVDDLEYALGQTTPSALREAVVNAPGVRWADVAGLDDVVQQLTDSVLMPLLHADAVRDVGLTPSSGALLHGAPGTGKTLLALALAQESGANVVTVNGPEIFSKWLGQSEEAIRDAFQLARQSAPTVLILDQIDAMAPHRTSDSANPASQRVVNQLLIELDSLRAGQIAVLGLTNRPDLIDSALLRPGRLGTQIHVPLPDVDARRAILRAKLLPDLQAEDVADIEATVDEAAARTEGMSGADLTAICDAARMLALYDSGFARHTSVTAKHLEIAVTRHTDRGPEAHPQSDAQRFQNGVS